MAFIAASWSGLLQTSLWTRRRICLLCSKRLCSRNRAVLNPAAKPTAKPITIANRTTNRFTVLASVPCTDPGSFHHWRVLVDARYPLSVAAHIGRVCVISQLKRFSLILPVDDFLG